MSADSIYSGMRFPVHPSTRCPNMINPDHGCKRHPDVAFIPTMTIAEWKAIDYASPIEPG